MKSKTAPFGALCALLLAFAFSHSSSAHAEAIYGWDVFCRGPNSIEIHAYQADDDFYIDYRGKKLKKGKVWASGGQWETRYSLLLFASDRSIAEKSPEISLAVSRMGDLNKAGHAKGIFRADDSFVDLNCYVRCGVDETDFDRIKVKAFPPVKAPSNPIIDPNGSL